MLTNIAHTNAAIRASAVGRVVMSAHMTENGNRSTGTDAAVNAATCVEAFAGTYKLTVTGNAGKTMNWQAFATFFQVV